MSDFVSPTLDLIHLHTGDRHSYDEITQWDVFASLNKKHHEHILNKAIERGGFCESMPIIPGSIDAVESLRKLGDVYVVTSPFDAPNWVYERTRWLEKNFGFTKKQIVNTSAKYVVSGEVLIDDSDKNLQLWKEHNVDGLAVLFDCPWNRHVDHVGVHRVHSWDTLVESVKAHLDETSFNKRRGSTEAR